MAKQRKPQKYIKGVRKKRVASTSTARKKPAKKSAPKSRSKVKTKTKITKKKIAAPVKKKAVILKNKSKPGSKAKADPVVSKIESTVPKNDALSYYNKLKSQVSEFYKEQTGDEKINRVYLENRTMDAFRKLKSFSNDNITPTSYKAFINNLDQIIQMPTRQMLDRDSLEPSDEMGFDWWLIDDYFKRNADILSKYKNIIVDLQSLLGVNEIWEAKDADALDFHEIRRQVAKLVAKMKTDKNYYAYFKILKSSDGKTIIFELSDYEPIIKIEKEDLVEPEVGEEEEGEEEMEEEEEAEEVAQPTEKKGKGKKGAKEKPAEEKPEKISAAEKAQIERDTKKGNLELLILKREAFEKSIAFNNRQVKEIADTIKVLKSIDIDFSDEKSQVLSLQASNKKLYSDINDINDKIKNL